MRLVQLREKPLLHNPWLRAFGVGVRSLNQPIGEADCTLDILDRDLDARSFDRHGIGAYRRRRPVFEGAELKRARGSLLLAIGGEFGLLAALLLAPCPIGVKTAFPAADRF